jgi:hypothetical protein
MFVHDDYRGFDVAGSKSRSEQWISLGDFDRSRIGHKNYWEKHVVPRLTIPSKGTDYTEAACISTQSAQSDVGWLNSKVISSLLNISACGLTHLRMEGKIEFEKIWRAYRYCLTKGGNNGSL